MQNSKAILEEIVSDINNHRVVLYMKGSKAMPMCGFSGRVVEILRLYDVDFETRDVLQNDALRAAIKEFSDWPTLPQLYVEGEFIGGCDIVTQLHEEGVLEAILVKE